MMIGLYRWLQKYLDIRYVTAVGTSVISKLATVLTQLIVMPLAAKSLGVDLFALYVVLLSTIGWLSLANPGIAPTLSIDIARNMVDGSTHQEGVLFSSAFFLAGVIALLVSLVAFVSVYVFPVTQLFGDKFVLYQDAIQTSLSVVVIAFLMQSLLVVFEAVHIGRQRQHLVNLVMALSALPAVLAVFLASKLSNGLALLIMATLLPVLIARGIFAVWSAQLYKSMRPRLGLFTASIARGLASKGGVYALAGTFGNFLAHVLPMTLVSRVYDTASTAAFATVMNLIILISGVTAMIVGPAVPGLASAWVERRSSAVRKAYLALLSFGMGFSVLVALALMFFGQWIMHVWMRGEVSPSAALMLWAGIYFVCVTWEVIHFNVLCAMREIKVASLWVFGRSLLGAVIMALYLPSATHEAPFVILAFSVLCVNALPLFLVLRKKFRQIHAFN